MKTTANTENLNSFFLLATSEFGEKINFSNLSFEGFTGIICLGENSVDISITIDNIFENHNYLSENENRMLDAFISYTQKEMRDQNFYNQNVKITEKTLMI